MAGVLLLVVFVLTFRRDVFIFFMTSLTVILAPSMEVCPWGIVYCSPWHATTDCAQATEVILEHAHI